MKSLINRRFRLKLLLWLMASILLLVSGLYLLFNTESFSILGGLLLILGMVCCLACFRYVEFCFNQVDDFFDSVQSGDASRRYVPTLDLGENLALRWNHILQDLHAQRQTHQESLLFYRALIERVPVPLVIRRGATLNLENLAAKRLFNLGHVNHIDDLQEFGEAFIDDINSIQAGERITSLIKKDNSWIQVSLSATKLYSGHDEAMIISIDPIQQELDKQEIESWQNLVRVFTHEIMNSMTPIRSLSQTAQELLSMPQLSTEDLQDVKSAVGRVGKRAEHLMKFVQAYRKISEPPLLQKADVKIANLFSNIKTLMQSQLDSHKIQMTISLVPEYLSGYLDATHMEQLLINLVQNSIKALAGQTHPQIQLQAYLNQYSQLVIQVEDNGVGINPEMTDQLFTPFFTSKPEGTGIGLFLAKQIVLAHDGSITAVSQPGTGAIFRMTF
jgi:two-component system, NtrC family, nitrogen regulation sensor histidine kinase NtrY